MAIKTSPLFLLFTSTISFLTTFSFFYFTFYEWLIVFFQHLSFLRIILTMLFFFLLTFFIYFNTIFIVFSSVIFEMSYVLHILELFLFFKTHKHNQHLNCLQLFSSTINFLEEIWYENLFFPFIPFYTEEILVYF